MTSTATLALPTGWALVLLATGVWNALIWPQFWRRIAADPRSRDGQGRSTRFLRVHAVLIGVSLVLGLATGVLGVLALLR